MNTVEFKVSDERGGAQPLTIASEEPPRCVTGGGAPSNGSSHRLIDSIIECFRPAVAAFASQIEQFIR